MGGVQDQHGGERHRADQADREAPPGEPAEPSAMRGDVLEQGAAGHERTERHRGEQADLLDRGEQEAVQGVRRSDPDAGQVFRCGGGRIAGAAAEPDRAVHPAQHAESRQRHDRRGGEHHPSPGHQQRAEHPDHRVTDQDVPAEQQDRVGEADRQQHGETAQHAPQEPSRALPALEGAAAEDPDPVPEQQGEQREAAVVDEQGEQHVHDAVRGARVLLLQQRRPGGAVQPAHQVRQRDAEQGDPAREVGTARTGVERDGDGHRPPAPSGVPWWWRSSQRPRSFTHSELRRTVPSGPVVT